MKEKWIPDRAEYFTMVKANGGKRLEIDFLRTGEPVASGASIYKIDELEGMLARADVCQQIAERGATQLRPDAVVASEMLGFDLAAPGAGGTVQGHGLLKSKYHREIKQLTCHCGIKHRVWVDVYDVLGAFSGHYEARIKPIVDHLLKKLLAGGERGHKDLRQDMKDVRDSAVRAVETIDEWA